MTSIARNKRRAKRGDPDPRYNGGIHKNTAGRRREKAAKALADALLRLPPHWGWEKAYWHTELKQQVYQMGAVKTVYLHLRDGWLVDFGSHQVFYTGTIEEITADVRQSMEAQPMTPGEFDERQAQWEAVHLDFDNGVA